MAAAGSMPRPSDVIAGSYRVERTIGTGGMGHVVAAVDIRTNQPVAIKLLSVKDDDTAVQRFFREARASMNIRCEHVVRVIEVGSVHGAQPFMVMERLNGQDLAVMVRGQKALPVQDVVDIAVDACDALAHAHATGVVHRDIKLSNLFYCEPERIIKVLDFGISKSEDREVWERTLTRTGADSVLGSPPFMSPEQIRKPKDVDGRTDIWALGVVLYRLLCGRMPFDGETVGELFATIMERDPAPLTSMAPHVSPAIAEIVHKCLKRDRLQRYGNVGQIARDLMPYTTHKAAAQDAIRVQPPGASGMENLGTMSLDGPMPQQSGGSAFPPGFVPAAPPSGVGNVANPGSNGGSSGGFSSQAGSRPSVPPPLPFSQPPPRASVPSAPQISPQPSRPSIPPPQSHQFTPTGGYALQQFGGSSSVPSIVSQSHAQAQLAMNGQLQTGPQQMWTGSGGTLSPEVFTGPVGTMANHPRRWPWIVMSFAALGLAIVLAWGASTPASNMNNAGPSNGTMPSAHVITPPPVTPPVDTKGPTPPVDTTTQQVTPQGPSAQPAGQGAGQTAPTWQAGPNGTQKRKPVPAPPPSNTAKPAGGGLHDNPYAQPQ
jgi:serine/threonine-protein kinase